MDNNKNYDVSLFSPRVNVANYFDLKPSVRTWGPRTLTDYELILIRKGIYRYEEGGAIRLILNPGDLLVIPPMERHKLLLIDNNKENPGIACIHNHPVESGIKAPDIPRQISLTREDFTTLSGIFRETARLFNGNHPYRQELLSSLCRQVWLIAGAYWKESSSTPAAVDRMDQMLLFIGTHYDRALTRKDLAREFGLTPEYVNALFKKELGLTPTDCINREKIRRGYIMLHNEGLSVKETAFRCGFSDEYYFARLFKKILAISPGAVKGGGFETELKRLRTVASPQKH